MWCHTILPCVGGREPAGLARSGRCTATAERGEEVLPPRQSRWGVLDPLVRDSSMGRHVAAA